MENWAIIIGINQYEYLPIEKHLKFAVRDAEKMKEFLCAHGGFPSKNVLLCSDDSQPVKSISTRPTYANLRRILREDISNHIQNNHKIDNIWFFFAGHGFNKNDQDYLLPKDGNPNDEETAIKISFVVDCLRKCKAHNIILALDMCRGNRQEGSRGIGTETVKITEKQGIITIFSCHLGGTSYEIMELEQGAFTYTLLNGLQQNTILRELEKYLRQQVPEVNRRFNKPYQEPFIKLEPAWKYDLPLLPSCTTATDVNNLIILAQNAELKGELEKARNLWWSVRGASQSDQTTQDAENAIKRIQKKLIFIKPLRYLQNIWNHKLGKFSLLAIISSIIIIFFGQPIFSFISNIAISRILVTQPTPSVSTPPPPTELDILAQRFSWGEKRLIDPGAKDSKQAGIDAFNEPNYLKAIQKFELFLTPRPNKNDSTKLIYKNDPEALIYLNNAKLRQEKNRKTLKIAVSVPISHKKDRDSVNIALEILRGVAQAQNDINQTGEWIGDAGLEVQIIDDSNDPEIVKSIANELVKPSSGVLAVIGHNTGDASMAGASVYQGKLVMISPTTIDGRLSSKFFGSNSYIFRATPNANSMANLLVTYIRQKLNQSKQKPKIAICFDSKAPDQISFINEFKNVLGADELINSDCELRDSLIQKEADNVLATIRKQGANSLLLAPGINNLEPAAKVAIANNDTPPLKLFGSYSLYTQKIPDSTGKPVNQLVLPGLWHPDLYTDNNPLKIELNPWNASVNWRTAMAYDVTCAIIEGLKHSDGTPIRLQLQRVLRSQKFSADGAGEKVKFDPSTGVRIELTPILVQVVPVGNGNYKFEIVQKG
ncbi:caspase family protein [Nostoc sp.]